jgi:hypothetical protein
VLDQYAVVLASLGTYASQVTDETAAKACGFLNPLRQGTIYRTWSEGSSSGSHVYGAVEQIFAVC